MVEVELMSQSVTQNKLISVKPMLVFSCCLVCLAGTVIDSVTGSSLLASVEDGLSLDLDLIRSLIGAVVTMETKRVHHVSRQSREARR